MCRKGWRRRTRSKGNWIRKNRRMSRRGNRRSRNEKGKERR